MKPSDDQLQAELDRWTARLLELRALRKVARLLSERRDHSIEAAYASVVIGVLAYAMGEAPSPATRININD